MLNRLSTRLFGAVLACVLVPNLCEAADAFSIGAGEITTSGTKLRFIYKGRNYSSPGVPVDTTVKTVEYTPKSSTNAGPYQTYYLYQWPEGVVTDGNTYSDTGGVEVETLINGSWYYVTHFNTTKSTVPL